MKISKYIILSTSLFLFACKGNEAPKPINLSYEEVKEFVKTNYVLPDAVEPNVATLSYTGATNASSKAMIVNYCNDGETIKNEQDTISINTDTLHKYKIELDSKSQSIKSGAVITLNQNLLSYLVDILEKEDQTLPRFYKHTYTRLADTLIIDAISELDENNKTHIHHIYDVKGRETTFYIIDKVNSASLTYDYSVTLNFVYTN